MDATTCRVYLELIICVTIKYDSEFFFYPCQMCKDPTKRSHPKDPTGVYELDLKKKHNFGIVHFKKFLLFFQYLLVT